MFNTAVQTIRFQSYPKKSEKYESHQKLLADLDHEYFAQAKQAVIEKWCTLCKNQFIDEVMQWRLRYLACQFTEKEHDKIKVKIGMTKSSAE